MPNQSSTQNLISKTVVITGASSGAGRAMAIEFAKERCNLVLAARREKALLELVTECEELGARAIAVVTDVTDADAMNRLATAASALSGRIDIWINNAGVLAIGPFTETPVEIHDQVIRTNLMGYVHGANSVLPYFKKQGAGILINNISVGAFYPTPYAAAYTASKFGLRGFSDALKAEFADSPEIFICDLYTAFLDTPGVQHSANFTGRALRPAPPVMNPSLLAKKTVHLARNPHIGYITDPATIFLKTSYGLAPKLARKITVQVMDKYFANAEESGYTTGNVLTPTLYGTSIHGGWATPVTEKVKMKRGLFAAALVAGIIFFARKF